mgnify:CR=1 FL=1
MHLISRFSAFVWVLLSVLFCADVRGACTAEHIAGNYASQFGPMACEGRGRSLRCCYENVSRCDKTLDLTLQDNGRELLGQWHDGGSSGAAKFSIDNNCNLVAGRWGMGATASQRWSMSGRTSPAKLAPPAPLPRHYLNSRGESLYAGDGFEVFRFIENPKRADQWCTPLSFSVTAEFARGEDFVFDPEFLYETLFAELLPRLRARDCPRAAGNITARVYLRDVFFNLRGERKTREAALAEGRVYNAPIATVSFYGAFADDPDLSPANASELNFLYNDNGVHRAHLAPAQVADAVGSVERLRAYYQRGGRTLEEYANVERRRSERQAAIDAVYQRAEQRYGTRVESFEMARLLAGEGEQLDWSRDEQWYFLRSYIQTTTRLCAEQTVGEPYRSESRFVDEAGNTVRESDVLLWYSEELRPRVKGRQIGSLYFGVYEADEVIAGDVAKLVKVHGCASEPLATVERYFY